MEKIEQTDKYNLPRTEKKENPLGLLIMTEACGTASYKTREARD
jgi:hypothetical protein